MIDQLIDIIEELSKNDKLFDGLATMYKKTFDSLVKAGFTEEQAMKIVESHGVVTLNKNK